MTCYRRLLFVAVAAGTLAVAARSDENALAPITCLEVSQDGQWLIDGSQLGIRIRRWSDLTVDRRLELNFQQLHDVCLSPDSSTLAIAGGNPAEHAVVEMYSWPELQPLWTQEFSTDVVYTMAFDPEGKQLVVGGHDHSVSLINASSGDLMRTLRGHSKPVTGVACLANGKHMLSCSIDQSIRVWDLQKGSLIRSLSNHTRAIHQVAAAADKTGTLPMVASVSEDKTVRFWQPTIGRMVRFVRLTDPVTAVAWSKNGERVFVGMKDGSTNAVDVQTLQVTPLVAPLDGWIHEIVVHPTQPAIAVGTSTGLVRKIRLVE